MLLSFCMLIPGCPLIFLVGVVTVGMRPLRYEDYDDHDSNLQARLALHRVEEEAGEQGGEEEVELEKNCRQADSEPSVSGSDSSLRGEES